MNLQGIFDIFPGFITVLICPMFLYNLNPMNWISERQSLAQQFAQQVQHNSSYLMSSRASRHLYEEGDQAQEQIARFKQQIQKRYLLSVANKFYSFPFVQLTFDSPFEDREIADLVDKGLYCLHAPEKEENPVDSFVYMPKEENEGKGTQNYVKTTLQQIHSEKEKLNGILEMIQNRRKNRNQSNRSRSKERKLGYKYGIIKEEDEEVLRKRLYTEPYEKQTGFILKKK